MPTAPNKPSNVRGNAPQQMEEMHAPMDKISGADVRKATEILRKYKAGKAKLEAKIIENEQFWKLRQWRGMVEKDRENIPNTAWLWSCIQSRYSDVMDSFPTCNFQPRQQDDKDEAKMLSAIVPVILEQNRYEETYSDIAWYMLKQGGCVQGVFWDGTKNNGLGDISVKKIDFINLFWEPGITDIQQSTNVFNTELVNRDIIYQRYPQTKGKLNGKSIELAKYIYDDSVDTSDKVVVVDWYYHTEYNGRKVLQYVKFVNDIVLFATENETEAPQAQVGVDEYGQPIMGAVGEPLAVKGLYDHAMYPFVCQSLFPIEGSLCGYGITDIGRDAQDQIDIINKALTDNAVVNSQPRYFSQDDGLVNDADFLDVSKPIIKVNGNIDDLHLKPVQCNSLNGTYVAMLNNKIEELKYVTSNQDSNNGVAPSGITAASAIAALQETAGKNARSSNKAFHRAYREVCYMIVELIRQFYDAPRTFRIAPDVMAEQFVSFSNQGLKPQPQMDGTGKSLGFRLPEFDIEVTSEKQNPYKKMEQNELALNFYNLGFFNPQMADQALACLQMMDFNHKEDVMQKVQANGTMQQLLLQFQQIALQLAQKYEPALADQIGQIILGSAGQAMPLGDAQQLSTEANDEHPFVEKARDQARESTQAD